MSHAQKKLVLLVAVVVLSVIAIWYTMQNEPKHIPEPESVLPTAEPETPVVAQPNSVIGTSVQGREIEGYTYGTGATHLLFVGGMHGGYEWNSVLLAYTMIDEIETGLMTIPDNITVTIIPVLNPDGLYEVIGTEGYFTLVDVPADIAYETGSGRFNANGVDLNRNFDCKWKPESTWRNQVVSAGTAAFSEPEARTLQELVENISPASVVFWHSQANTVYASECTEGVLPKTIDLMNAYATAANYNSVESFDAYPVSGDAEGWLASIGIPAITVELETRTSAEWERNRAGVMAMFSEYSGQ
jgi:predicted deacylase